MDEIAKNEDQILYDTFLKNQNKEYIKRIQNELLKRLNFEKTIEFYEYSINRLRDQF